ncbi:MAG TPA: hypothetical protein VGN36_09190 [Sphingorhabdus sp.]|nr:hypothetical protein [Sphingorhabdus sp.]
MKWAYLAALFSPLTVGATPPSWQPTSAELLKTADDDIGRNIGKPDYFDGVRVSEYRFSENGFDWHLIRFASSAKPDGPLWMVPHDDENAAFDAMIAAIKERGGVGVTVNSGPGSLRRQAGNGVCGVRAQTVTTCDPNRNFDASTPLFTDAFLSQRPKDQPIVALHTNTYGFSGDGHGGRGEITVLDREAYRRGETKPRDGALFAVNPKADMANYDTLGLTAYRASDGTPAEQCGRAIADAGVHFWHERVAKSDGSMSNYLILNRPEIAYFNAESRAEIDLAVAAARHRKMIEAYLDGCKAVR